MTGVHLRHGVFMAPYHSLKEDPTMCIHRDLELIEWLDRLGYDEAWIGEHHSGAFEMIASPEVFIAAAAERTKRIRFGTGVVSLPYHNPLMVANRIILLDHITRGRVMFGAGPGLLVTDAMMLGIDPNTQRDRMAQSLELIRRLFLGEIVTEKTDWYNLSEARAHLLPYTKPYPEIAVASSVTPSGGRLAGKYDFSMLCLAATDRSGFDALATNWQVAQEIAAEHGRTMDANKLRLVGLMHIAETREKAYENVKFGLQDFIDYRNKLQPGRHVVPPGKHLAEYFNEGSYGVIGTPDDAIALIKRLQGKQGQFGFFLQQTHDWADWEGTKKSYELYARYVMPHFRDANRHRASSLAWADENGERFDAQRKEAARQMNQKHDAERAAKIKSEQDARPN